MELAQGGQPHSQVGDSDAPQGQPGSPLEGGLEVSPQSRPTQVGVEGAWQRRGIAQEADPVDDLGIMLEARRVQEVGQEVGTMSQLTRRAGVTREAGVTRKAGTTPEAQKSWRVLARPPERVPAWWPGRVLVWQPGRGPAQKPGKGLA